MCLRTVAYLEAATMPLWIQIPKSPPTKVCHPLPSKSVFNKVKPLSTPDLGPKQRRKLLA